MKLRLTWMDNETGEVESVNSALSGVLREVQQTGWIRVKLGSGQGDSLVNAAHLTSIAEVR